MNNLIKIPSVRDFLLDTKIYSQIEQVMAKYQLPTKRSKELLHLSDAVVRGEIKLAQMPELIVKAFQVDAKKAQAIAADVAGYHLLPLEDFLPEVPEAIKKWGGKIEAYPELRIHKPQETLDDRLRRLATEIGLELPEHLLKRFIFLAKGYLTRKRDRQATITLSARPINLGGLELSQTQAEGMLKILDQEASELLPSSPPSPSAQTKSKPTTAPGNDEIAGRVVNAHEFDELLARLRAVPPPKPPPHSDREPLPAKTPTHALTKTGGVPRLRKSTPSKSRKSISKPAKQSQTDEKNNLQAKKSKSASLEDQVNQALVPAVRAFQTKRLKRKDFTSLAVAHVHGRREPLKTYELLKGKFKLQGQELDAAMDALEAARAIAQGMSNNSQKSKVKSQKSEDGERQREKQLLSKRHAVLTKKISQEEVEPVMPGARVSAARTKNEELQVQESKIDRQKVAAAEAASKPKKAKVKINTASMPPQTSQVKRVEDVKHVRKLVGPVEELGNMTPVEFRRLSSDPVEACRKIEDKLALLESNSYESRIAGVKAWRGNKINRLYVTMAGEALQKGVSIAEVATLRRNQGEESLSPAEIQAIVSLNKRIKF